MLSISYLPKEDCFASVGAVNAIRVYAEGSKLRERFGHGLPPTHIQFYGRPDDHFILSAGRDATLKIFSPEHESGNRNLGKTTLYHKSKKAEHQMAPISEFATSSNRESAWDNVVAIHRDGTRATTWSTKKLRRGDHWLSPANDNVVIVSVACSQCGNMAWVGREDGSLFEFNLQSGKLRKQYLANERRAHDGAIRGLGCQALQVALISASCDGRLKAWRIKDGRFLEQMEFEEPILKMKFEERRNLAAVALGDFSIALVDCSGKPLTLSRRLPGHQAELTTLCWSSDAHWLATAAMDATIRVWDVATAQMIDQFKTPSIATTIDFR